MTCMDSDIFARPMTEASASVLAVVCVYSQFVFCSYFLAVSVFRKRFTQTTAGSLRCDVNHWSVSEPYADAYSHYGRKNRTRMLVIAASPSAQDIT